MPIPLSARNNQSDDSTGRFVWCTTQALSVAVIAGFALDQPRQLFVVWMRIDFRVSRPVSSGPLTLPARSADAAARIM